MDTPKMQILLIYEHDAQENFHTNHKFPSHKRDKPHPPSADSFGLIKKSVFGCETRDVVSDLERTRKEEKLSFSIPTTIGDTETEKSDLFFPFAAPNDSLNSSHEHQSSLRRHFRFVEINDDYLSAEYHSTIERLSAF